MTQRTEEQVRRIVPSLLMIKNMLRMDELEVCYTPFYFTAKASCQSLSQTPLAEQKFTTSIEIRLSSTKFFMS